MFETGILTNGVASTCAELDIPIVAYSPLGRGVLTGSIRSTDDIAPGSALRMMDRFQGKNLDQNFQLVRELNNLALNFPGSTTANLALSWIRLQSQREGLPSIIPISGSSKEANVRANAVHISLSEDELKNIDRILTENEIVGPRGYEAQRKFIEG